MTRTLSRIPLLPAAALATAWLCTACAVTSLDPEALDSARAAIEQARSAGAEEYSPLELRFANEYLIAAEVELEDGNDEQARRFGDRAEVEAMLALARTRAALARAELAKRERELEQIRSDLVEAFGEEVLEQ